jgi:hypothetical protein
LITQDHFPSVARDTGSGYERADVRVTNILDLSSIIARVQAIGPYALATTTDLTLRRTGVLDLESLRLAAANSRPARQAYAAGVWIASFAAVVGENSGGSGVDVEVVVVAAGDGDGHHLRARGEDRAVDPQLAGASCPPANAHPVLEDRYPPLLPDPLRDRRRRSSFYMKMRSTSTASPSKARPAKNHSCRYSSFPSKS